MANKNIDFHDSVQNTQQWKFVKEKKERIKVKAQKAVNSQIYLTTYEENSVYVFLFFTLAPDQAFGFQKVQGIVKKMQGETQEQKRQYEECKRMLHLNWDGVTPLTHLIKRKKKDIIREQKYIHTLSQKITQDEARQLLKSSLSQRKIQLDSYTNDGNNQQFIIPAIQNANDYVTIIYNEHNRRFLIAFFSHSQDQVEQKLQQSHTFVNRPLNPDVVNPDDRPLPAPQTHSQRHLHQRNSSSVPTQPRKILDPEEKFLNPPSDISQSSNRNQFSSKNIPNPDDRLLPLPPRTEQRQQNKRKLSESKLTSSNDKKTHNTFIDYGKKAQEKVEHVVEQLRKDKCYWIELGVTALIIAGAIKIFRQ